MLTRNSIYILILLLSCLACAQTTSSESNSDNPKSDSSMTEFKGAIGVQTYSFRNYFPKDMPGTLDRVQALGIKEIEGGPGRLPPEEYKKMCDARGMKVVSTGASFEELRDDPGSVAQRVKDLGAKYVMCAWVPHEKGLFNKDDADKVISVFNAAGKLLAENGITFCYHPHGYEFQPYEDGTLLDYLIQNTDPRYVSYEMDIFWVQFGGGDPAKLLLKYPNRWKLMHLKDMKPGVKKDLTGNTDVENDVALGTGQLDMPAILRAAEKVGIVHYFIEDESSSVWNQVEESIAYLKSVKF